MNKGERLLREVEYLKSQSSPVSAMQLASIFGVVKSTIQDDIASLTAKGCVFETSTGRTGGYILTSAPSITEFAVGEEKAKTLDEIEGYLKEEHREDFKKTLEALAIYKLDK